MFKIAFTLLLSYIAAAPLTSRISMDLTQTEWGNIWTYIWWIMSFGVWALILGFAAVVIAAIHSR